MFEISINSQSQLSNMPQIKNDKCSEAFGELVRFHNLPDLEITPVQFLTSNNLHARQLYEKQSTQSCSKNKETRERLNIQKLLMQLPQLYEHFNIHKQIGEGTYSTVYLATFKNILGKKKFAVKHLTQNFSINRIQKELKFMQMIGGSDNVVNVFNCLKSVKEDCVVFVMPYLEHRRFSDYVLNMDACELQLYMKNLFIALRRVHAFSVIHRDVKPGNFLYNRDKKEFLLVDFGLAQMVDETRGKRTSTSADEENKPIDYSKRKRSGSTDENTSTKVTLLSPLKSRENIMNNVNDKTNSRGVSLTSPVFTPVQNTDRKQTRVLVEKTPLKSKNHTSSSHSSSSRKKLFCDEVSTTPNAARINYIPNAVKFSSEVKFTSPSDRLKSNDQRSFTPLVGRRCSSSSFVQVRNSQVVNQKTSCACSGEGTICSTCRGKRAMAAPRAGTPGFRPPEVLLKYVNQTTAVDMWAAGVVMLCVLSGCYPFFKSPSDMAALAEIMTMFGSDRVIEVAAKFGRKVSISSRKPAIDLKKMCIRLRNRRISGNGCQPQKSLGKCLECQQTITELGCVCPTEEICCENSIRNGEMFPNSAYHLLLRLLDLDPETRITAQDALLHPFITGILVA